MVFPSKPSFTWLSETKDHPFTYPDADVILATSDEIQFHLHKLILSLASPFFRTMFTLPQSHMENDDGADKSLSVIDVPEKSSALHHLLRLIYPIEDPVLSELDDIRGALAAALKYEVVHASNVFTSRLVSLVEDAPLRVYGIACILDLEDIAVLAAKIICSQKLLDTNPDFAELDDMTAGAYHRLRLYYNDWDRTEGFTFVHPRIDDRQDKLDILSQPHDACRGFTDAPHPFDRPDADIILCSSDLVRFHIHSSILRMASPGLGERLNEILQASGGQDESAAAPNNLRILNVPEDSQMIAPLLRVYYQLVLEDSDAARGDHSDYGALFTVAEKYGMKKAIQHLKRELMEIIHARPLQVYFLAVRLKDYTLAIQAAREWLSHPLGPDYAGEMEAVSARAYYRLLGFRTKCVDANCAIIKANSWLEPWAKSLLKPSETCLSEGGMWPCWFIMISRMERAVRRVPGPVTVDLPSVLHRATVQNDCAHCRPRWAAFARDGLSIMLGNALSKANKKVALEWD